MTHPTHSSWVARALRLRGPLGADPTARMLNSLLWSLTLWFGIWGLILLPYHVHDWFWSMQNQFVTDAGLISSLVLLQRGRFRAATFTYLGCIWFFATHVMLLNGGIRSHVQVLYVTLPISAAWLLGYEAAIWIGGVCMSSTLLLALLELAGVTIPRRISGTPLGSWAVFGMACLIGALPVAQILRDLRAALDRSSRAEDESSRTMERLRTEIREHERTEQALRESQERFRVAANAAPVMIMAIDAEQNATFFNKGWLDFTGRTLDEELGDGWMKGIHSADLENSIGEFWAAHAAHQEYHAQFRLRRADGEYRLLLCHGVPRLELDRTFNGHIACCVDITELKRTQEEALARHKWESLGVLAGGIAHDFNNLLGIISALSELLSDEVTDFASRETAAKIQSVALRASEIVRQLMVYAGQEGGAMEEVELAALIREMLSLVHLSASRNAAIEAHLPDGLPPVHVNVAQIRQVLLNLITNASEALGGREGVITIRLSDLDFLEVRAGRRESSAARYLRLEVSDSGCGMSDQVREAIFDPFFSTKGPGRGLGLAAVQGIIRSHGGRISVASSPGTGSRFEILLPCSTGAEQAGASGERRYPSANVAATILMVEDEAMLRSAVAKLLRGKGFCVLEAGDGRTALEFAKTYGADIDVALLDVTLPGLSGREVLEQLRDVVPDLKVIVTSAYGKEQALETLHAVPSQPYIRKPYSVVQLIDLIRAVRAAEFGPRAAKVGQARPPAMQL